MRLIADTVYIPDVEEWLVWVAYDKSALYADRGNVSHALVRGEPDEVSDAFDQITRGIETNADSVVLGKAALRWLEEQL